MYGDFRYHGPKNSFEDATFSVMRGHQAGLSRRWSSARRTSWACGGIRVSRLRKAVVECKSDRRFPTFAWRVRGARNGTLPDRERTKVERDEESLAQNRRLPRLEVSARPEDAIANSVRFDAGHYHFRERRPRFGATLLDHRCHVETSASERVLQES